MTIFSDTFGLAMRNFTTYPEMPDPQGLIAYARRAEALGFDSLWVRQGRIFWALFWVRDWASPL